jgi:hypothetical protein
MITPAAPAPVSLAPVPTRAARPAPGPRIIRLTRAARSPPSATRS